MLKNAVVLFVVAFVILIIFLPSYTQMQDLKQKNREYAARIAELETKNSKMENECERLKNDPEYLEKVAREKMGLIRENEKVYKVVPAVTKKNIPVKK